MENYKHILLATDFAETSKKCILRAINLVNTYQAKLSILHVVEPLPAYAMGYIGGLNLEKEMFAQSQKDLEKIAQEFNLTEAKLLVETGSIKSTILDAARKYQADLIIVGSHGRHGLEKLIGSTAGAVLQGADRDVLVVHTYD